MTNREGLIQAVLTTHDSLAKLLERSGDSVGAEIVRRARLAVAEQFDKEATGG